jgi:hypothetical protein
MTKFTGRLSGSLAFINNGIVSTQLVPGAEALQLTGSLNISGSQLTFNGRNVMQEIDDLTNPTSASLGPLNRHTASINLYTASNSANINNLLGLTSSIPYLNSLTSSYVTSPEIANVISSSLQISDLGFIKELPLDIISSSAQITALGFDINATVPSGTVSSSVQIAELGFITGSNYDDIQNIPSGLVSGSTQISNLGYITSASAASLGFGGGGEIIPSGTVSSSAQISNFGFISSSDVPYDGNRLISNTAHPLFNIFNPGSDGTVTDFLDALFYPNTAPTITTGNQVIEEYTAINSNIVTLAATDPESNSFTFSLDGAYVAGLVTISSGVLKLAVKATASTFNTVDRGDGTLAHPVQIKVIDSIGASATKTIYVHVTPNEAPKFRHPNLGSNIISSYSVSRNENATSNEVTKIYFTDAESDNITINSGSDASGHFDILLFSNYVSIRQITASLDYENITSYNFSVTASDSHYENGDDNNSFTALPITINVTDNTQPSVNNQTLAGVNESSTNGAAAGTITTTDPEGDTVVIKNSVLYGIELDGSAVTLGTYSGTSHSDPNEDAFDISSNGIVTRKTGVNINSDLINSYIYQVTVTDSYNNGTDTGLISIPISDDTVPLVSGDTTLYVIESAVANDSVYDNANGYSGTVSRFTADQSVSWSITPSNVFSINSSGYITLTNDISGSSNVGGSQISGLVTATNSFSSQGTKSFIVNVTDNEAPNITFTNTNSNLNTNKARTGTTLVDISFSDPEGNGIDIDSFSFNDNGNSITATTINNSTYQIKPSSNLAAGNYTFSATVSDSTGFASRTSSHTFTIAQAPTGTLSQNGTFRVIESAVTGDDIKINSNGRTGTTADVNVSYSPNYGGATVQAFTSSLAYVDISAAGKLTLGADISGSIYSAGDTLSTTISYQDQYNNHGSTNVNISVVANNIPTVTVSEQSGLESETIANGTLVAQVSISDSEADYPITVNLTGTNASSFTAISQNVNGTSYNIQANSSLAAGTYSFVVEATDSFGKVGTDSASISVAAPAVSWYAYMYEGGVYATSLANSLTMLGDANDDGTVDANSTFAAFAGGNVGQGTITHSAHSGLGITKTIAVGSGLGLNGDRANPLLSDLNQATGSQNNSSLVIVFPSGSDFTLPETMANSLGGATAGEYVLFADRVGTGINDAPQSAYVRYFDFDSGNNYPNTSIDRFGVIFTQGDSTSDINYFLMASSGSAPTSTQ